MFSSPSAPPLGRLVLLVLLTLSLPGRAATNWTAAFDQPGRGTKPWVYWYWISDNISKDGITRDLEAMQRAGIGEAFIGNVDTNEKNRGPVKTLSPQWWDMVEHAVREGRRTGVKVGLFNCPGWSQSGGPWITSSNTMRYVVASETRMTGPRAFRDKLPVPKTPFQDIAVLAFPAPRDDTRTLASLKPGVTATPARPDAAAAADGRPDTACALTGDTARTAPLTLEFSLKEPLTARSLVVHPDDKPFRVKAVLQADNGRGEFVTVREFDVDRHRAGPGVGPIAFGPVAVTFPEVTASRFRLVLRDRHGDGGLAEVELTGAARVEHYIEKQLGKMFQDPLPLWDNYLWRAPLTLPAPDLAVATNAIVNLSSRLAPDGTLAWDVPPGEWVVLRTGMTPTGARNGPASPEGSGYEVDKMNRALVSAHFDAYVGYLLKRLSPNDRKGLGHVVADSYEMGPQNWTDDMAPVFRQVFGYDPVPWLPVLTGRVVGSAEESERFLWDLRRMVADRVSSEYVGGLRAKANEQGLSLWLENYGHWGFPGEFLSYGGASDRVSGEFWTSGDLGSIELRAASSAANTYGKRFVSAEAFTSGGPHFQLDPWALKKRGDWSNTEGVNHFVLHVYIHQPDQRVPGINSWFCTEFNRHNTWFPRIGPWIEAQRRQHAVLQEGRTVADVLYFIGEDAPKMTGIRDPALPPGYAFDYINAEVIERDLAVKDGWFVLPHGNRYRLLVLPPQTTMRPALLRKLKRLVEAGGTLLGPAPQRSPSLAGFPACDDEVRSLAASLWTGQPVGQGRVLQGVDVQTALAQLGVPPDVLDLDPARTPWIHRADAGADAYYLSNQTDEPVTLAPSFRVTGRQPEWWDPVAGTRRRLPDFTPTSTHTRVPLALAPRQSGFVVFREPASAPGSPGENFPAPRKLAAVPGPWTVAFDPAWGGPASLVMSNLVDWTTHPDPGVKYYSGRAVYRTTVQVPALPAGARAHLNLGAVRSVASVRVNGTPLGLVWCAPWRIDATRALRAGRNDLEIEVINGWHNRLVGDAALPESQRRTWVAVNPPKASAPLAPSGLTGPVTVETD